MCKQNKKFVTVVVHALIDISLPYLDSGWREDTSISLFELMFTGWLSKNYFEAETGIQEHHISVNMQNCAENRLV